VPAIHVIAGVANSLTGRIGLQRTGGTALHDTVYVLRQSMLQRLHAHGHDR
jgi:hypothetical protein